MPRKPADPSQLNEIAKRFFNKAKDAKSDSKSTIDPAKITVRRNSSWSNYTARFY